MRYAAVLALFLIPSLAFGAGFAKQSLFLSQQSVTEGETVFIHAVVNNTAPEAFAGEMAFSTAGGAIGSAPVSLKAGEAETVSVSWKPPAGEHKVVAELMWGTSVVERQSATFTIAKKPALVDFSSPATSTVESSQKIQDAIAGISPTAAGVTEPLFTLIDSGRESLSNIVGGQLVKAKNNIGNGESLGVETVKQAQSDPMGTLWFILWTLYLYVLTILNFLIGNAGIFYPVLAILFLYTIWRLFRRIRRPAY